MHIRTHSPRILRFLITLIRTPPICVPLRNRIRVIDMFTFLVTFRYSIFVEKCFDMRGFPLFEYVKVSGLYLLSQT